MKNAFCKETFRSITHSLGRFFAIAAIVALGTGFYAGLRMSAPDMRQAADAFFDGTNLMDIRVVSTLGLSDDDIAALKGVQGVDGVMPARETDVMATIDDNQYATRIHSLPTAALTSDTSDGVHAISSDPNYINRPILVRGSWPQSSTECVISADLASNADMHIGDTVNITEGTQNLDDTLTTHSFTISGFVNSSYYATSSSMGETSLGSGSIQQYLYVNSDAFVSSVPYTEAFITVKGAKSAFASSATYKKEVSEVLTRINDLAPGREQARLEQLKSSAQGTLDEEKASFQENAAAATSRLDDAAAQLRDANQVLSENEQKLTQAKAALTQGSSELAQKKDETEKQLQGGAEQIAQSQQSLAHASSAFTQGNAQWQSAYATYKAGMQAQQKELNQWQSASDALAKQMTQIKEDLNKIAAEIKDVSTQLGSVEDKLAALNPSDSDYITKRDALEKQKTDLKAHSTTLEKQQSALQASLGTMQTTQKPSLEAKHQKLMATQKSLSAAKTKLDQTQEQLTLQGKVLYKARTQLDAAKTHLDDARSQASDQIRATQDTLDASSSQIASGKASLALGREEVAQGQAQYQLQSQQVKSQLADAQSKLNDAQAKIDNLAPPTWLAMDRSSNYGAASFASDADRIDSIASVFPFIFFLVAALVSLTTMTRMVDEERPLIGTFKALGYHHWRIAFKYLIYAALSSGLGSLLGIVVLSQVLPAVIMQAYGIIYFIPALTLPLPISPSSGGLAAGLGMGVTLLATLAAASATLREGPAALMLPPAPKPGKRILLERIPCIWKRLSFSWKVTFRNLFRYKKRLIMTIIGIAGCTALLLTGLGLSNAINDIINKQFNDITKYDATLTLSPTLSPDSQQKVQQVLQNGSLVSSHAEVDRENTLVSGPDTKNKSIALVVPKDPLDFGNFVTLRTRVGHHPVSLDPNGLVLTEKLAGELGVKVGDTINFVDQDAGGNPTGAQHSARVTGIVENYIYHYAYMGSALYETLWGHPPTYDTVLACTPHDAGARSTLQSTLLGIDGVKTVSFNDETIDTYRDMISSVGSVVVVLISAAAALAVIVLYNLTNINITERIRELATLKVLGFTSREMNDYIFREIFLLTAIGCGVGLVLGVWMEGFVVITAEVDQIMFGRSIHLLSFLIAFILTMIFTVLVMLAMRGKLRRINMVESLKSNE